MDKENKRDDWGDKGGRKTDEREGDWVGLSDIRGQNLLLGWRRSLTKIRTKIDTQSWPSQYTYTREPNKKEREGGFISRSAEVFVLQCMKEIRSWWAARQRQTKQEWGTGDTERVAVEDRGQKANLAFTSNHSAKPFYSTRTEICFFFCLTGPFMFFFSRLMH